MRRRGWEKGRFLRIRGGRSVGMVHRPGRLRPTRHEDATPGIRAGGIRARARRLASLLVGAVLALTAGLGSGVATAYWTTTGTGVGAATTATPQAVTLVAATATVSDKLIPGETGDLLFGLHNPNGFAVTITSIEQRVGPGLAVVASKGGCIVTGVTVPTQAGLAIPVAKASTVQVLVRDGAAMAMASESGCQGATFEIPVIVTVRS